MIGSIKHKALRKYWVNNQTKGLNADWLGRLRRVLLALDAAGSPEEMNLPGFYFHALTGDKKGRYAVRLTSNYRITFGWDGEFAINIDVEDYH